MASKRLLKMYIRDENKVFRAVEGIDYGKKLIFLDKSVYTLSSIDDDDFLIIEVKQ